MWLLSPITGWLYSTTTCQHPRPSAGGWTSPGSWSQTRPTEQGEYRMGQCIGCMLLRKMVCHVKPEAILHHHTVPYKTPFCAKCANHAWPQLKVTAVSLILTLCVDWVIPLQTLTIELWYVYGIVSISLMCLSLLLHDVRLVLRILSLQLMAVASGQAGRVLARPLFRRPNLHMRRV